MTSFHCTNFSSNISPLFLNHLFIPAYNVMYLLITYYLPVVIMNIFFTESGKLYTFGSNDWGQLGHGNTVPLSRPKLVKRK